MRKLIIFLVTGMLWCTNVYAEFLELNKCFRSEAYGPRNLENKKKANKRSLIAESWDGWYLRHIYTGEYTVENCFSDGDFEQEYPTAYKCMTKKNKKPPNDSWHKDNFKQINRYEDHVFSIDTSNGSVSRIQILNDEYLNARKNFWNFTFGVAIEKYKKKKLWDKVQKFQEDLQGTLAAHMKKYDKNYNYQITSYAGGVIIANRENREQYVYYNKDGLGNFYGFITNDELTIDLNASRVEIKYEVYVPYKRVRKWGKTFGPLYKDAQTPDDSKFTVRTIFLCDKKNTDIAGGSDISSGTAFFINNKGNLLTNNHVVDGCVQSKINYFGEEYDAKLISTDKNLDLALLKVDLKPKSYLNFSGSVPKKRQPITLAGYPLGQGLSDDLKINDGKISSLKGFENNSNEVTVDIAINPGNSGGPIVDQSGNLVAIAVSGLSKEVTEGINFGIKSWAAANFLSVNDIQPNMSNKYSKMNDDRLNELLEESTVYTFCKLK